MSAAALVSFRSPSLAWSDPAEDQRLFRRVTGLVLVGTLAMAAVLSLSKAPKEVKSDQQPLAAPMAKLLLEHKPAPVIPAKPLPDMPVKLAEPVKEAPKKEVKVDKPAAAAEAVREPVSKSRLPVQEAPRSVVSAVPTVVNEAATQAAAVDAARKKVAGLGLLAARDDMAQVRSGVVGAAVKTDIRQSGGGQAATQSDGAALTRSLITTNSSGGSQQVHVPISSRSVAGGAGGGAASGLATRSTTVVTDEVSARAAAAVAKRTAEAAASKPKRSSEDIRLVLSRNKGALDAIFNRAAREDPTLQGKVVFEIKIAPTGEVLACKVVFSELHAPEVESKLVARIRMIDFGAKDVEVTTDKVSYDFLPA